MRKIGTFSQLEELDCSLCKIKELILHKGEPQRVAISFLSYPEIWNASYPKPSMMEIHEKLSRLRISLQKLMDTLST